MAIHSSIPAWRIPWTKDPGGLQSMGMQKVGHNWATEYTHTIALQYCVGFCWTTTWIGHKCICVLFLLNLPPTLSLPHQDFFFFSPHQVFTSSFLRPFVPSLTFLWPLWQSLARSHGYPSSLPCHAYLGAALKLPCSLLESKSRNRPGYWSNTVVILIWLVKKNLLGNSTKPKVAVFGRKMSLFTPSHAGPPGW